jgi:DNA-binding NarL/FixJ family response regulator
MTVLLVEENSAVRRIIRQLLTSPGTWIPECANSADAIEAYGLNRPDFVVTDIGMRDLDGIEVSRQMKAIDPAARIVLVSDYDDAVLRESAKHAGACGYVLKDNLLDLALLLRELSDG